MTVQVNVKYKYAHYARIREIVHDAAVAALPIVAHAIADDAESGAPVDTGAEAAGFYVITATENGYADAVSRATSAKDNVVICDMAPPPDDDLHAVVSHAPQHTIFQEFGTAHQSGTPTFVPAIEAHKNDLPDALEKTLNVALATLG